MDQLVSFFFFCGKGVLRFLAVQPHTCEQVKGMGEYTVSVVLKERQKVIIAIAWQVRRIQVRKQLIWICEFWKQL